MIRERERQVTNGAVVLAAGVAGLFATVAWFIYAIQTRSGGTGRWKRRCCCWAASWPSRVSSPSTPTRHACCSSSATTRAPSRATGPALGQPVLHQAAGLAARAQLREREAQGQRHRRQPDRDRRGRGVAGGGHRRGRLRGRRLRATTCTCRARRRCATWRRSYPYDAHDDGQMSLRGQHRRDRRAAEAGDPGAARARPASR